MMKQNDDHTTDVWLDKLDTIAAGEYTPSPDDDELLHFAAHLSHALGPLRKVDNTDTLHRQRLLLRLHKKHNSMAGKIGEMSRRSARLHQPVFSWLVASLFLLVLSTIMLNSGGLAILWDGSTQLWHSATSPEQIQGISVASLARPHAGLKPLPLIPAYLPNDVQAANYGVITDASNPNLLTTFVADYHIERQDVLLYEQPSYGLLLSSTAQPISIGAIEGQLFQDDMGNHALQWYQHGMVCQITSKLPVGRLVALAKTFEPLQNWQLLR